MKHQRLAYVIVGLLSIGAGVAIAGVPSNVPVDATIIAPATTDAPAPTVPETTLAPTTTVPPTTEPDTDSDTDSDTSEPGPDTETSVPDTDASEADASEPDASETDASETDDSVSAVVPDRDELTVIAANGANIAGAAVRSVTRLEELGYVDVAPRNGTAIVEFTAIYFADGFEDAALRLADDLDLLADFVGSIDDAPAVLALPADVELLAYIGLDRA